MTTTDPFRELRDELDARAAEGLLRKRRIIDGKQQPELHADGEVLLSFCSNDYLGLASHPALIAAVQQAAAEAGVGGGASHLITGHHRLHHEIEEALAQFVGLPRALFFSTGYMANLGVISALVGRGDAIFADRLNHASLNDAAVLSRADLHRYPHNDVAALEKQLAQSTARRKLVVADAVFSMDGDIAPVPQLLALCERYDAWLMLDDAHGFGVLGAHGKGTLEHFGVHSPRIIYMATLGKAAGVSGAFVAGEPELVEYLIQRARTYIYTTAMPPVLAAALLAALPIIEKDSSRREHLKKLIATLRGNLKPKQWRLDESVTPIQPLIIGSNEDALRVSEHLREYGILVPAIRPPTVPQGTARLRITLSAAHTVEDVMRLVDALHAAEGVQ
ncbi:MAG: 8-amino-7-oxononanoate synthase [Methylophilaceae bacterium]|jgi:8-amino-7-oxononanoate synthase|nr:8-amino-7-oxononanoate synthase [Methylophilaceae bacterium]